MSEPHLATAMLTVAFAAVMLVAAQLYLQHTATKTGPMAPPALAALAAPAL